MSSQASGLEEPLSPLKCQDIYCFIFCINVWIDFRLYFLVNGQLYFPEYLEIIGKQVKW